MIIVIINWDKNNNSSNNKYNGEIMTKKINWIVNKVNKLINDDIK